ncbi:MAG: hypothetical protein QOJ98_3498, partial [Acidobacteriota bacterium]|nr:hypothetical protein [Acidobacteriota bacterium]
WGKALAAADRAILIAPGRAEALFNRAVALESLSLAQPAIVAWRRYLMTDVESPWAAEARERKRMLETLTASELWDRAIPRIEGAAIAGDVETIDAIVRLFPQEARTWGERRFTCDWEEEARKGDSVRAAARLAMSRHIAAALRAINGEELLADAIEVIDRAPTSLVDDFMNAYRLYGEGRLLYADRDATAARSRFEQSAAIFRRLRSPMFRVAEYYLAGCLSDLGENQNSLEIVERHLAEAPAAYIGLRAQLLWQKGLVESRSGRVFEAMAAYSRALEIFDRQSELSNAAQVRAALDIFHASIGREAEAWRLRRAAFRDASRLGNPRVLQTVLMAAAGAEAGQDRWDVAMSFYSLSIDRELTPPNPVHLADAAIWRALAAHKLGWEGFASRALVRARAEVSGLRDAGLRASSANRLRMVEAVSMRDRDPMHSAALLTSIIEEGTDLFQRPEAHLERGRAWRVLRRQNDAIADLREALRLVEQREESTNANERRDSYFATADAAGEELMDVLDEQERVGDALETAERNRARSFAAETEEGQGLRVPENTMLVYYNALPARLLIFLVSSRGTEVVRVPVARATLEERIARMTNAIGTNDEVTVHAVGRELYELLITPLSRRLTGVSRLVIVPDGVTAQLPFVALRAPSGQLLLESALRIVYAPSGGAFTRALLRAPSGQADVLAVGDPDFDRTLFPDLRRLPDARTEAREVAKLHRSTDLLVGGAATPDRVMKAMRSARIVDIAAHAVLDRRDPARSALLLASSTGDEGVLHMRNIAGLTLTAEVVMLAGCHTAAVVERAPPVLRSFAFAFLAAGSRNVVGSLWAADDAAARVLSRYFHQQLRAGAAPSDALREAQLAMLRSSDPSLRTPSAWSGYQLYGSGS